MVGIDWGISETKYWVSKITYRRSAGVDEIQPVAE
jgi:hypothetical protein